MDVFVEQMIKRKRTGSDYFKIALCVLAICLVPFLVLLLMGIPFVAPFGLLILVGLIYILVRVIKGTNIEFEYCFTNGAMDVDKIIAARRRKRVTELNARTIDIFGTVKNPAFDGYMKNREIKKIYACTAIDDEGVFFVVYSDKANKKTIMLFNPNDTIKDGFRRLNPQKVFLTD